MDDLSPKELRVAILKTVAEISFRFTVGLLRRQYNYNDMGSAKDLLLRKDSSFALEHEDEIKAEIYKLFGLDEDLSRFSDKEIENIVHYFEDVLTKIDVVTKFDIEPVSNKNRRADAYILTQPALRYEWTRTYLQVIREFGGEGAQEMVQKISEDTEGKLLEACILNEIKRRFGSDKSYDMFKFYNRGIEIDLVVFCSKLKKLYLIEIKRSSQEVANQRKHLDNADVLGQISDIIAARKLCTVEFAEVKKYVLYQSGGVDVDGVKYVNIENFLTALNNRNLYSINI